jgi:hypothetical protein
MNERIKELILEAGFPKFDERYVVSHGKELERFAKLIVLIVKECTGREELLGAIARGWCHEKNSHKIMDKDLALAIFNEIEQQIKSNFGVEE